MEHLKIVNGKIILSDRVVEGKSLYLVNGKIFAITNEALDIVDFKELDASGNFVAPGFIDIHVHGGNNHDFMDNDLEGYLEIAKMHARHGTTAMTPTTLSCENEDLLQTIHTYEKAALKNLDGARFIGLHIEGPYFAKSQRGAQDPRYLRNPDPEEYQEILKATQAITRWSAAPELPGAIEFGKYLQSRKVLPAIAHTDASYEEVIKGFEIGFTHVTHLYSAMSGVFRKNAFRYAGVIESAYLIDDMTVEIIADGVHLPAPLLQLVYKIKGPDKIALVTDAMRGAGMPPGKSILGSRKNGMEVIIEDQVAKLSDRSSFAGSVATTDQLVRNMIHLGGVGMVEAIKMMTLTPAQIMRLDHQTGSIEPGKIADIVLFDAQINILTTIVNGKVIYQR